MKGNYYSVQPADNNLKNHPTGAFMVDMDGVDHMMRAEVAEMDFASMLNLTYLGKKENAINVEI